MHSGSYFSRFVLQILTTPQPFIVTAISSLNMTLLQFTATVHVNSTKSNYLSDSQLLDDRSLSGVIRMNWSLDCPSWYRYIMYMVKSINLISNIYQRRCPVPQNDTSLCSTPIAHRLRSSWSVAIFNRADVVIPLQKPMDSCWTYFQCLKDFTAFETTVQ